MCGSTFGGVRARDVAVRQQPAAGAAARASAAVSQQAHPRRYLEASASRCLSAPSLRCTAARAHRIPQVVLQVEPTSGASATAIPSKCGFGPWRCESLLDHQRPNAQFCHSGGQPSTSRQLTLPAESWQVAQMGTHYTLARMSKKAVGWRLGDCQSRCLVLTRGRFLAT